MCSSDLVQGLRRRGADLRRLTARGIVAAVTSAVNAPQPTANFLGRTVPYKWLVAAAFVLGLFMDILDTTIVNVALPTLERQFQAPLSSIEWVVLGYLLSLAVWIPASGWIGDLLMRVNDVLLALPSLLGSVIAIAIGPLVYRACRPKAA